MVGPWGSGLPPAQVSLGFLIVGLWRLAERAGPSSIAPLWQDRTLFAAILAAASWMHSLAPTLQGLALMALAYCLDFAYRPGLTPIGRAHVCTPVPNSHPVCRPLLENINLQSN